MVLSIPLITVVALILILNSIVEHIFNWVFRVILKEDTAESAILFVTIMLYILKWAGVIAILINIFK